MAFFFDSVKYDPPAPSPAKGPLKPQPGTPPPGKQSLFASNNTSFTFQDALAKHPMDTVREANIQVQEEQASMLGSRQEVEARRELMAQAVKETEDSPKGSLDAQPSITAEALKELPAKPPLRTPQTHAEVERLRTQVEQYELEQLPPAEPGHPYRKPSTQAMVEKLRANLDKNPDTAAELPLSAKVEASFTSILDTEADRNMWLLQGSNSLLEKEDYSGMPRIFIESAIPEEKNAANLKFIRDNYPMFADRMLVTNATPEVPGYFQMIISSYRKQDNIDFSVLAGLGDSFQVNLTPGKSPVVTNLSGILLFTDQDPWVLYWEEMYKNLISLKACARNKTIISLRMGHVVYKGYFTNFFVDIHASAQTIANFSASFLIVSDDILQPYKDLLVSVQDMYVQDLAANKKDILRVPTSIEAGTATLQTTTVIDSITIYSEDEIDNVIALDESWQTTVQTVIGESEAELDALNNNIATLKAEKASLNSADISDKEKLDRIDDEIRNYEQTASLKENNINMLRAKFAQGKASTGSVAQANVSMQLSNVYKASKTSETMEASVSEGAARAGQVVDSFGAVSPSHAAVTELEANVKSVADYHATAVSNQTSFIRAQINSLPEPSSGDQQSLQQVLFNNITILESKISAKTDILNLLQKVFDDARTAGTFGPEAVQKVVTLTTSLTAINTEIQNSVNTVEASVKDYSNSVSAAMGGKVSPLLKSLSTSEYADNYKDKAKDWVKSIL